MKARYLFPKDYMADPSANVFNGKLYIYPSHDWDSGECFDDDGGHFQMKDYHVLSVEDVMEGEVTDHGVILDVEQVPWAEKQMWDNDVVEKNGKYYLIFSAKDYTGVFHLGVAVADRPEGPFKPEPAPIIGSYSIDPCVFKDDDGQVYCYFGGIWGGQLQWYRDNKLKPAASVGEENFRPTLLPEGDEVALPSRVARMTDDVLQFAEAPKAVLVVASSRHLGCTSRMGNTTSHIQRATPTTFAMPSVTAPMDLSPIKVLSWSLSWAGQPTIQLSSTKANGICSITTAYLPTTPHGSEA